jgi:nucleotide-binding universal stress UspA family protein
VRSRHPSVQSAVTKEVAVGTQKVVIGIDSSQASRHALYVASDEADRRGAELVIAHAPDFSAEGTLASVRTPDAGEVIRQDGERLLQQAAVSVRERWPHVTVRIVFRMAPPADLLLSLSASADLLVVGTSGAGRLAGMMLGSVSQRVAGHASCPVLVVPATDPRDGSARIVVGISDSPGGRAALRAAFEEAERRGATLVAVRAWGYSDWLLVDLPPTVEALSERQHALVQELLAPCRQKHPSVPVEKRLVEDTPARALRDESAHATIVVVGSRHDDGHWPSRLGPLAFDLMHRSACPVLIVGRPRVTLPEDPEARRTAQVQPSG